VIDKKPDSPFGLVASRGVNLRFAVDAVLGQRSDSAPDADQFAGRMHTLVGWKQFHQVAHGVLYSTFGLLKLPVFARAAMALGSVSVVTDALRLSRTRLLTWRNTRP